MNLFDMYSRKDRAAQFSPEITQHKLRQGADLWRGLILPNGSRIVVPEASSFHPLRERPSTCGWKAKSFTGTGGDLKIGLLSPTAGESWIRARLGADLSDVVLPWSDRMAPEETVALVLEAGGDGPPIFLGVSLGLDRSALIARASGHGVEIGPGPHPQIRCGPDSAVRSVIYLEQQLADDWRALYGSKQDIDASLWENYRQGTADHIPVEDGQLDFIFSSHVFEHLANPIGHLRHWAGKLKSGGVVLAIIPELGGAKDYRQRASTLPELMEEDRLSIWEPTAHHYERYVRKSAPTASAEVWMKERRSIHAHFYTPSSVKDLLEYACERLGYSRYEVISTPNQKEFHFVLCKG